MKITEKPLSTEIKDKINRALSEHAVKMIGFDGLSTPPVVFQIQENDEWLGACVVQIFYGSLHIKNLVIKEEHRNKGLATKLVRHAFEYGKKYKCKFAFVETMSFQALDFYKKLGFKVELKRDGFAGNTSFYYLKKDL